MSGLRVRDEGGIRVLTLSRPPGNTLDLAALKALKEEAAKASAGPCRALLIESDSPRYFSSGLDLDEMAALPEGRRREPFESLLAAYRELLSCPKPVVAAMAGSALLGGWIVAMACDWRVLGEDAKISLAEIRAGLSPTPVLIERALRLAADPRAVKEMVLRGKALNSVEAFSAGLVDEVLPPDEVGAAGLSLAGRLAKAAPRAYGSVKAALNGPCLDEGLWRRSLEEFHRIFAGEEAAEGVAALRAKRRPRWEAA